MYLFSNITLQNFIFIFIFDVFILTLILSLHPPFSLCSSLSLDLIFFYVQQLHNKKNRNQIQNCYCELFFQFQSSSLCVESIQSIKSSKLCRRPPPPHYMPCHHRTTSLPPISSVISIATFASLSSL